MNFKFLETAQDIVESFDKLFSNASFISNDDIMFLCIGTDRSTGDSLGPLIGTFLTEQGYTNVLGTLANPVHASNLHSCLIPADKIVIGIDSALGKPEAVGTFHIRDYPLRPGEGVGKNLPEVGQYSVAGVVNVGGFMEYLVLQNTRLNLVINMAKVFVDAVKIKFPLAKKKLKVV